MVCYQINLQIDESIQKDYLAWIGGHIKDVLKSEGFKAAWLLCEDPESQQGRKKWIVQYLVESNDLLQVYLRDRAPQLREEGVKRFGHQVTAQRVVFREVQSF